MSTSSLDYMKSRYVSGGSTEVGGIGLEWWERAILTRDTSDTSYVVERRFEGRLDLISYMYLGDSRLWWVIGLLNNIIDPSMEVVEGTILWIPAKDRVDSMLSSNTGGIPSTRETLPTIKEIV